MAQCGLQIALSNGVPMASDAYEDNLSNRSAVQTEKRFHSGWICFWYILGCCLIITVDVLRFDIASCFAFVCFKS